ncbi:MAG: hypothetical protein Q8P22_09875 [Chloroflexota bacterium]|nr:hypothetical protein [Chloroflexota bacterium]
MAPDKLIDFGGGLRFNASKYNRQAEGVPEAAPIAMPLAISRKEGADVSDTTEAAGKLAPAAGDIRALLRRAERGDPKALADARATFTPAIWQAVGDLALQVEREWIDLLVGKNELVKEAVGRQMAAMAADLAGPSPTPLERLLAEQIVACWLQVQYVDHQYGTMAKESITLAQADYHQRRMTATHQRYLSAIKTLAVVRRLLRPAAVQVNIGERQVNIAAVGRDPMTPGKPHDNGETRVTP